MYLHDSEMELHGSEVEITMLTKLKHAHDKSCLILFANIKLYRAHTLHAAAICIALELEIDL